MSGTLAKIGKLPKKIDTISQEVLDQSPIPIEIRLKMTQEVGKPRTRAQLRSSLFLSNKNDK